MKNLRKENYRINKPNARNGVANYIVDSKINAVRSARIRLIRKITTSNFE